MATNLPQGSSHISGRPLTNTKHEHFAHLVTKGESPARAYVLCGYSEHGALQSGNRLLRKPDVAARAEELKAAVSERQVEKMAVDRAWVMAKLTENVQRAMQVEPVRDREGNPTGQYICQGGVANRALELLGKELGMFQPKPEKDQGSEIHEFMARLNARRDRVAKEKREGDAAAADSTNLLRRESEHSRIVGAERNIATHEPVGDMADPAGLIRPAS
jgi:phage terminase small subunit